MSAKKKPAAKKKPVAEPVDYWQMLFRIADDTIRHFIAQWNATIAGSIATLTKRPPVAYHYEITVTMPDKQRHIHISTDAAQLPISPHSVFTLLANRNAVTLD